MCALKLGSGSQLRNDNLKFFQPIGTSNDSWRFKFNNDEKGLGIDSAKKYTRSIVNRFANWSSHVKLLIQIYSLTKNKSLFYTLFVKNNGFWSKRRQPLSGKTRYKRNSKGQL